MNFYEKAVYFLLLFKRAVDLLDGSRSNREAELESLMSAMIVGIERVLEFWDAEKGTVYLLTAERLRQQVGEETLSKDAKKLLSSLSSVNVFSA